jgi:hypothetical protein
LNFYPSSTAQFISGKSDQAPQHSKNKHECSNLDRFSIEVALKIRLHQGRSISRDWKLTHMIEKGMKTSSPVFATWIGKSVVMLVVIRQCHVPMPCRIVGETAAEVRVRIHPGWEMDVHKNLILAVEEAAIAAEARVN